MTWPLHGDPHIRRELNTNRRYMWKTVCEPKIERQNFIEQISFYELFLKIATDSKRRAVLIMSINVDAQNIAFVLNDSTFCCFFMNFLLQR